MNNAPVTTVVTIRYEGRPFSVNLSLRPLGEVAWRVRVGTSFWSGVARSAMSALDAARDAVQCCESEEFCTDYTANEGELEALMLESITRRMAARGAERAANDMGVR